MEIAYELVGEGQPWVLTPGGRFTKEVGGLPEMAKALADHGRRVLTWDRPNCGASSVVFRGRSESEVQAEALGALLRHLELGPTVIAGGSGGARVSLLAAARNPDVAAGLAMWWISGGVPGLLQLANYYCMPSADAAWHGGMEAVAALDQWQEVQEKNPSNRARILAMDRREFIETMDRWMVAYCPCDDALVPGLDDEDIARLDGHERDGATAGHVLGEGHASVDEDAQLPRLVAFPEEACAGRGLVLPGHAREALLDAPRQAGTEPGGVDLGDQRGEIGHHVVRCACRSRARRAV